MVRHLSEARARCRKAVGSIYQVPVKRKRCVSTRSGQPRKGTVESDGHAAVGPLEGLPPRKRHGSPEPPIARSSRHRRPKGRSNAGSTGSVPRPEGIRFQQRLVRDWERMHPAPRKAVRSRKVAGQPLRSRFEETGPPVSPPPRFAAKTRQARAHSPPPAPETDPEGCERQPWWPVESAP